LTHLSLAVLLSAAAALAQISGPISGWVFDESSKAVRPVLGLPGAALLGDVLDLGELERAAVAPDQDYLIAIGVDGSVRLARPATRAAAAMETLHGAPRRIAFSPQGSSVLFLNESTLDVYTGLPDKPALARTLALEPLGSPSAMAVSDDGAAVLALVEGKAWVAGEAAEWKALEAAEAFAFAPGSRDAALAGPNGALRIAADVARAGEVKPVAEGEDGAPRTTAVVYASANRVVAAQGSVVSAYDLATQARSAYNCDCTSAALSRMGSSIRLTEASDAPLWLLDGAGEATRLVFVPPAARKAAVE
jgi:hypothetical protein